MKSEVVVGNELSDHIRISVSSYERAASNDSDDDNWLRSDALVTCGAWQGRSFSVSLVTRDFTEFLGEVTRLNQTLKGQASFSTLEGQLEFKMLGNGLGQIVVKGEAICSRVPLCALSFEFEIDQTYLPNIVGQLQGIVSKFPAR